MNIQIEKHNIEINQNLQAWNKKPFLQKIYTRFYKKISSFLSRDVPGLVVELGSGIGNLRIVIPECVCTDIFPNPWIDKIENAYSMSFKDHSVSNLILFDVFHHLQYPGSAFKEFYRVLSPGGRVILFEPDISLFGLLVYGLFHHEPIGLGRHISWFSDTDDELKKMHYYSSQGNANRIFLYKKKLACMKNWQLITIRRLCSISYVLSGGYSKPQLFPTSFLPVLEKIDQLCGVFPSLFSVRMIVVLEKK